MSRAVNDKCIAARLQDPTSVSVFLFWKCVLAAAAEGFTGEKTLLKGSQRSKKQTWTRRWNLNALKVQSRRALFSSAQVKILKELKQICSRCWVSAPFWRSRRSFPPCNCRLRPFSLCPIMWRSTPELLRVLNFREMLSAVAGFRHGLKL